MIPMLPDEIADLIKLYGLAEAHVKLNLSRCSQLRRCCAPARIGQLQALTELLLGGCKRRRKEEEKKEKTYPKT